jgi:hypothetical protein
MPVAAASLAHRRRRQPPGPRAGRRHGGRGRHAAFRDRVTVTVAPHPGPAPVVGGPVRARDRYHDLRVGVMAAAPGGRESHGHCHAGACHWQAPTLARSHAVGLGRQCPSRLLPGGAKVTRAVTVAGAHRDRKAAGAGCWVVGPTAGPGPGLRLDAMTRMIQVDPRLSSGLTETGSDHGIAESRAWSTRRVGVMIMVIAAMPLPAECHPSHVIIQRLHSETAGPGTSSNRVQLGVTARVRIMMD